jgi:transcriptional regulator with XRE-family HTH domain
VTVRPNVDGREVIKCDHCRLVQFKRASEVCLKCKRSYALVPEPVPTEPDGSAGQSLRSSGERSLAAVPAFPTLSAHLKFFREGLGLSQAQLARRMGVPRTYISKLENSKCVPVLKQLQRIADALGLGVMDLLNGAQSTERDPYMLEIMEAMPTLSDRNRDYLVDMVRSLATTKERQHIG